MADLPGNLVAIATKLECFDKIEKHVTRNLKKKIFFRDGLSGFFLKLIIY